LPIEEQDVFYLYAEYGSIRKVAEETNAGRGKIGSIINDIKERVRKVDNDKFFKNYILTNRDGAIN
jgi:hypothetical protein